MGFLNTFGKIEIHAILPMEWNLRKKNFNITEKIKEKNNHMKNVGSTLEPMQSISLLWDVQFLNNEKSLGKPTLFLDYGF